MKLPPGPTLAGTYPDPSIQRAGGDYYLVTSTMEYFPALPIFHSTDLVSWTQVGHVIDRIDQLDLATVPSSGGLFAPTIRWANDIWYVVCTVVHGEGRQGNFLVTSETPVGPWSDPIWLDDAPGIDPSLFFDSDGRAWFVGTHLAEEPDWPSQTVVWMQELDLQSLRLIGPTYDLWHGALEGAVWAEGPHIYRRNGWYYLLASEGGTEFNHAISVARSRCVTGPYDGYAANPVFSHRHLGRKHPVTNVGHADLVETPEGEWVAMLLAARPHGGYYTNLGRETFAVEVEWEEDWPIFAPGIGQVLAADPAPKARPHMPDTLEWNQIRNARVLGAVVDVAAATVTLPPNPWPLSAIGTPSFFGVRQKHRRAEFTAIIPLVDGAGMAARQSEGAYLLAIRDHGVVRVWRSGEVVGELPSGSGPITLLANGQIYTVACGGCRIVVDGRYLSSEVAGGFLGVWFGLVALGDAEQPVVFRDVSYGGE